MSAEPPAADGRPKRFYAEAAASPDPDGGFGVRLDARGLRTPAGVRLAAPTLALAELVSGEWGRQREIIDLRSMPATRLAFTAVDRVSRRREAIADEIARFASADLLCYFADSPQALIERQTEAWGPLIAWAEGELGASFERVSGVIHRPQPDATLAAVRTLASGLDNFALAGLAHATGLFGSAILAMALMRGRLEGEQAFALSHLDESFQEAAWGLDAEASERRARLAEDARMIETWFDALGLRLS